MKNSHAVGSVIFLACTLASFFSLVFHVGWIFRSIDLETAIFLIVIDVITPVILLIVVSIDEKVKLFIIISCTVIFVVTSYIVLFVAPNFILPENLLLGIDSIGYYFTSLACIMVLCCIGLMEVSKWAIEGYSNIIWLVVAIAIAGVLTAAIIFLTQGGWLWVYLVPSIIVPMSTGAYYFLYPPDDHVELNLIVKKVHLKPTFIKDTSKGLKITFFSILAFLNAGLILGINGIDLETGSYALENWIFYASMGIGSVSFLVVGKLMSLIDFQKGQRKIRGQLSWLAATIIIGISPLAIFWLQVFQTNYHGSVLSHIIDGTVIGLLLGTYLKIIITQHPPKSFNLFVSVLSFIFLFLLVLGNYIKGIPVVVGEFNKTGELIFPIVTLLNLILVGVLSILLVITIIKERKKNVNRLVKNPQDGVLNKKIGKRVSHE